MDSSHPGSNDESRPSPQRLSTRQSTELAERIAELTQSGVPLSDGFRAAADEAQDRRLASMFRGMAEKLDAGQPLTDVLGSRDSGLPEHVRRLLEAGIGSGRLHEVMSELVEQRSSSMDRWRSVRIALAYPFALWMLAIGFLAVVLTFIVPPFEEVYLDFEISLPRSTLFWIWMSDVGGKLFLSSAAVIVLAALLVRFLAGRARWRWFLWNMPILGGLLQWSAVAEFTKLLRIMLEQRIALPDALRLTADGVRDANVAAVAQFAACEAEAGKTLTAVLIQTARLPATLIPVVRWGEQTGQLPAALGAAAEMFEGRIQLRSSWLTSVLPPITFVFIAALAIGVIVGLCTPLVSLIYNLV
jgi:general secretion pathway protein F